jgi:hypothetical protein
MESTTLALKPKPAYEELINFVDYPVKYPDRTATWTRDSPMLTQLDGIGMMEMEELERRKKVERYEEDMITQIVVNTGHSAQLLRAMNRGGFVPLAGTLADNRPDGIYQVAETQMYDDEDEQQITHDARIGMMQQQLNQDMGGDRDLAGRLAAWRFQPSSQHIVFCGEDQQSEAAM